MEAPRPRTRTRRALLWSALGVIVIAGSLVVLFVARNADGKGSGSAAPHGASANKTN